MKKKLLALVLCCVLCTGLVAPAYGAVEELADLRVDRVAAYSQEDGVYTVVEEGLYGFYRTDGTQLLAPAYSAAGDFHNGMAAVSFSGERLDGGNGEILRGGRFGYMDVNGALVVPMEYSRAFPYCEDRAFAIDAESGAGRLLPPSPRRRFPRRAWSGSARGWRYSRCGWSRRLRGRRSR